MFGSMVLEVAIGLIFVYLLLSLVLTALTELVAGALRWRAKDLWKGIQTLLDSGKADEWVKRLYDHPLIQGLSPRIETAAPADGKAGRIIGRGPSYIPSRTFSLALLEILREPRQALKKEIDDIPDKASLEEVKGQLSAFVDKLAGDPTGLKATLEKQIAAIPDQASIADIKQRLSNLADVPLSDLLQSIPSDKLRRSLTALLNESKQDVEALKENVEIWFNNSMARVSGWYKRKTQTFHLVFGILLAFALNVDTILIVEALSKDQTLRQSVVSRAEAFAKQTAAPSGPTAGGSLSVNPQTIVGGDVARGTVTLPNVAPAGGMKIQLASSKPEVVPAPSNVLVPEGQKSVGFEVKTQPVSAPHSVSLSVADSSTDFAQLNVQPSPAEQYRELRSQIDQLGLPIGWIMPGEAKSKNGGEAKPKNALEAKPKNAGEVKPKNVEEAKPESAGKPKPENSDYRVWPGSPLEKGNMWGATLFHHFFGWLLTAFAISLGAPFWFDMLNKVISVRSAGRAPEETPKSPQKVPTPLEPGQTPAEARLVLSLEEKK